MNEKPQQQPAAPTKPDDANAGTGPATAPARPAAAADLDLGIEEIQRPELMKEGFVGQER